MRRVRDLAPAGAWRFIILVGVVSLFSDMTYEGARSISGPFLGELKASALVVGVVAGLGEFLGYALRLASGYLTDRLGRYWPITFAGYALNLLAVPLLALAGSWEIAAVLLVAERMGKAIRTPARDAMLSHAAGAVGRGWGFGFHEAMDQIGAVTGPLIVAAVLYFQGGYRAGVCRSLAAGRPGAGGDRHGGASLSPPPAPGGERSRRWKPPGSPALTGSMLWRWGCWAPAMPTFP